MQAVINNDDVCLSPKQQLKNPGVWIGCGLGVALSVLAGYETTLRQRRLADAMVALMQAQAEMNAEALVRAARRSDA